MKPATVIDALTRFLTAKRVLLQRQKDLLRIKPLELTPDEVLEMDEIHKTLTGQLDLK